MSYKIGDAFIVEIDSIYVSNKNGESRYGIKGFNTLIFDDYGLGKLKPLNKYDEEGWKLTGEHLERIRKKSFEKGLDDAWKTSHKIHNEYTIGDVERMFGKDIEEVCEMPVGEVMKTVAFYEQQKKDKCPNCGCDLSATMFISADKMLETRPVFCPNCGHFLGRGMEE